MSVTLRQGDEGDIDALMEVMTHAFDPVFGEAWNTGQCLGILSLPDVWLVFAEEDARTIGFAMSRLLIDEAELLLLAVEPEARGRGAGRALIERTAAIATGKGARRLLLEVRDGNHAFDLYHEAGFSEIGRRPAYYRGSDGRTRDALTLARPLVETAADALPTQDQSR
jgi:ribosomal-protein-alanine N-acetyltransferase